MNLFLIAIGVLLISGLGAFLSGRNSGRTLFLGLGGAVAGCLLALVPTVQSLWTGQGATMVLPWSIPGGRLSLGVDPLSAFFLLPVLGLCALAAVYGSSYLKPYAKTKSLGMQCFCFNLLIASMALVILSRNALVFLLAWEVMSLSSFFLVMFEHEKESVREAGWTYLVATHIGTAFLLALFLLLGREAGSWEFSKFASVAMPALGKGKPLMSLAGLFFLLAVVGFGTKAGFMPMHVWLPQAHPAAPSHVSAVLSGVMIKTGIYGLIRILTFLGPPPVWWGWTLIGVGAVSGILGVLFALAKHNLKRLLAYSSVENIGIIAMGLGLGLVGMAVNSPLLVVLGFAGALLHVLNHAVFKGLLFLSAGSVLHATGTMEIDHLGGLLKKMPVTGFVFLTAAAAISGLPPLSGFVSEFLIFMGGLRAFLTFNLSAAVSAVVLINALALIGGLAAACFTKAFGIVFLGQARSSQADHAHEAGPAMLVPMGILAVLCASIGLAAPLVVRILILPVQGATGLAAALVRENLDQAVRPLFWIAVAGWILIALAGTVWLFRRILMRKRVVATAGTWDCGYAQPTARMQYTASSFVQPITRLFSFFLRSRVRAQRPGGIFPKEAYFSTQTPDVWKENLFSPIFSFVDSGFSRMRRMQHGRLNLYVLGMVVALLALLWWKLR